MAQVNIRMDYIETLKNECKDRDVDFKLADSIIHCESSWNTYAVRFEPNFNYIDSAAKFSAMNRITLITEETLQKFSFGLGQIMGATTRWLGYTGPLVGLCEPDNGIEYCVAFLHQLGTQYSRLEDIAAAYNAGSVRYDAKGVYINKKYVDRVMSVYSKL